MVNIRAETLETPTRRTIHTIKEKKSSFSEKIAKTGRPLSKPKERKRNQINKTRDENRVVITDSSEIKDH